MIKQVKSQHALCVKIEIPEARLVVNQYIYTLWIEFWVEILRIFNVHRGTMIYTASGAKDDLRAESRNVQNIIIDKHGKQNENIT